MSAVTNYNLPALSNEGGLSAYLAQIKKFPMLDAEEEYMLAKNWRNTGNIKSAEKLVTSHLRLVAKIAMGYKGYGLPVNEMISEGNVGLMQAVKKFKPEKGFRLATYAMWWIKASIQEYILRSWSLVKIGTTTAQKKLFFNLKKVKNQIAPEILKFSKPVWLKIDEYKKKKKKILFEGAQGILLDVDHGTYPFVTSSNTVASSAATGSGCGPNSIHYVLGITKAYTTRVGEGPFPTELKDEIGELLGIRGKEFGTVTSRKRRCGWFDGVLVRQTIKVSGIDGIALTKLDVLDELDEIKICVKYELNGEKLDYLPAAFEDQQKIKPIYKIFPGWKSSTSGIKNIDALPENAKKYIFAVEDFIGAKISSISTSPEREDTILIENPFDL